MPRKVHLVGSVPLPDQNLDNVLASAQGAITGEKFERFDVSFVGAGDTLSAALAALLATGADLPAAVGECLAFLDQALDAGFRPGMGNVIPDRFFWALPPGEEDEGGRDRDGVGGLRPDRHHRREEHHEGAQEGCQRRPPVPRAPPGDGGDADGRSAWCHDWWHGESGSEAGTHA